MHLIMHATSSPTPSTNMEYGKEEEKSDVYSTNMTEAMGAGKYADFFVSVY